MDCKITKYKARLGLMAWGIAIFGVASAALIIVAVQSWVGWALGLLCVGLMTLPIFSVSYTIEGNRFSIRSWFQKGDFPIDKISEVRLCTGFLASAATSTERISIKFSDRKVLKSAAPLEISPADRMRFIRQLMEINPYIKFVQ